MTTQNKSPMIIIERPHQRPATVWIAWGQDDFIRKVSGMRRMENYTFDADVDGGAEFDYWKDALGDDLSGLDVLADGGDVLDYQAHPPQHNAPPMARILEAAKEAGFAMDTEKQAPRLPHNQLTQRGQGKDTSKRPWAVLCAYDCPYGERGAVLSKHSTHELAERKIRRNYPGGFCRIEHIGDMP